MVEIDREIFMTDPVFHMLYNVIKHNHETAEHTLKTLSENKDIKDFCVESRHFATLPKRNSKELSVHYDISSWLVDDRVLVKIEKIGIYDDTNEFLRAKSILHTTIHSTVNHN